jgi:hypothetical protein
LSQFVEQIENAGILSNVTFELGNEPEAKSYFWGTTDEYVEIARRYQEVLSGWDRDLLCCGFTATLLGGSDSDLEVETMKASRGEPDRRDCSIPVHDLGETIDKKPCEYINFINNNQIFKDPDHRVTPSFHYYTAKITDPPEVNVSDERVRGSHITEFNMIPNVDDETWYDHINSPLFVSSFAEFLRFTYTYSIPRVYFHKLIDSGDNDYENGFFDIEANPKTSYDCFRLVLEHLDVQDGYFAEQRTDTDGSGKYVRIQGGRPQQRLGGALVEPESALVKAGPVLIVAVEGEVQFSTESNSILHYYYQTEGSTPPDPLKAWRIDGQEYPGDWILYSQLLPEHPMVEGCECPR